MDYNPYMPATRTATAERAPVKVNPRATKMDTTKGMGREQTAGCRHWKLLPNHHRRPHRMGLFHSSWALAVPSAMDPSRRFGGRGHQPSGMNKCRQQPRGPLVSFTDGCRPSVWCTRQPQAGAREISSWVALLSKKGFLRSPITTGQPGASEAKEINKQQGDQQNQGVMAGRRGDQARIRQVLQPDSSAGAPGQ